MFSIIIPTHKPKYLQSTIDSLLSLEFDRSFFEVIVVENPEKTDRVSCIMSGLPDNFKHIYCPTIGANPARNCGIKNAQYDTIILTDDDCIVSSQYLTNLFSTIRKTGYELIGGPLLSKFIVDKPKWITKGFLANLSEINWTPDINFPSDLKALHGAYLVSANLVFTKNMFNKIGPFEEEHGYKGNNLFANDEVRFIERGKKYGVLYDPKLKIDHIIGPERCVIEYFIQRKYSQGYVDAILKLETDNPVDLYHNFMQWKMSNSYSWNEVNDIRNEIQDEKITRQWIRYKILTESAYNLGFIHKLEGKQKCKNVCVLLMDAAEQNIFSRL